MRLLLTRRLLLLLAVVGAVLASLGPAATVQAATPEGLTMTATAMLDGHARIGSWMAIDVHVRNLRKKIEDDPRKPARLATVYGVGYKLA